VIVFPSASKALTDTPELVGPPITLDDALPALGVGTPVTIKEAGIPSSVIVSALSSPTVIAYVPLAMSSGLPLAPVPSYVVSVKVSDPGGEGGPVTEQPEPQVVELIEMIAGFPEIDEGVTPAESELKSMEIEATVLETYSGLARCDAVWAAVTAGILIVNVGRT